MDEGKVTLGIFIDFLKAFDTINHGILLERMAHYGIRGVAFQWFDNYLILLRLSHFRSLEHCQHKPLTSTS